jgi:uncharacterized membrane protein (UPF0127 family)
VKPLVSCAVAAVLALVAGGCADAEPTTLDSTVDATVDATVGSSLVTVDTVDTSPPPGTSAPAVLPEGFSTITARITETDGEVCDVCVWLADTAEERGRGLMGVTDLGDAAGMVFRFDEPTTNSFFMLGTPTPLSIAWFAPDGSYATSTDMEPCIEVPEGGCPLYAPGTEYELALEVFRGGLEELGVGPGARLELLGGTESATCG